MRTETRLLALNGVHALDGPGPCQISQVEPPAVLEDLRWTDRLVVRARAEGAATLACGGDRFRLEIVKPARLELVLGSEHVTAGQRFQVRAIALDGDGRELEIGELTELEWRSDPPIVPDNDASAGEFGLCPTCFGMQSFRAEAAQTGTIEARFGEAIGTLRVSVRPAH